MNISRALFREIEKHALSAPRTEVCGFLYKQRYVPLTNRSSDPFQFEADPPEIASALAKHGEPEAVFHTHPNGSLTVSKKDQLASYYKNSTMIIGTIVNGKLKIRIYRRDAETK